jgi:UTP--glucose-1-phosphate uridylyltransferase
MRNGERRFDIGNYESYWKAFLHFALRDPELGPTLREFVKGQLDELDKGGTSGSAVGGRPFVAR